MLMLDVKPIIRFLMLKRAYSGVDLRVRSAKVAKTADKRGPTVFGTNLKRRRKAAGITQAQLAGATGVKQGYVSQLESGEIQWPTSDWAHAAAAYFQIPMEAFWQPLDPEGTELEESLQRFRASGLAPGITDEDLDELRTIASPWGPLEPKVWFHLYEAMKAARDG